MTNKSIASPSGVDGPGCQSLCSPHSRQCDENNQQQIDQPPFGQHDFGGGPFNESADQSQQQQRFHEPMGFGQDRPMPPICAQCAQAIVDPYILRVHPDLEFHPGCLKCVECTKLLDENAGSAFLRDEKILCREDYIRLYSRRCHRCRMQFQPTDLVMRARQLVFHMNCFNCVACNHQLMPGDQFLLRQDELFCRPECFMVFQQIPPPPPMPPFPPPQFANLQPNADFQSPKPLLGLDGGNSSSIFELAPLRTVTGGANGGNGNNHPNSASSTNFARPQPLQLAQQSCPSAVSSIVSPLSFSNPDDTSLTPSSTNASTPTGGGGAMLANGIAGHFPLGGGQFHGGGTNFEPSIGGGTGCPGSLAFSGGGGANSQGTGSNCSSSSGSLGSAKNAAKKGKKDKPAQRVRTVLNEQQLKILKVTYNSNQRPDTVTKEHLVEQTGLNPRVIRVWFQNKRCKDKKRQLEHREKLQNLEKEQALRGVRISGIGPLTVSSPAPMMEPNLQNAASGHFPPPVDIRQIQQNSAAGLWAPSEADQIGALNGLVGMGPQQMDPGAFQHPGALAIMSNGIPPDLMHPNPGPMLPPIPMFSQHAISE